MRRKIVVVLKGYPRLSETFIAQELLGLEQAGFELALVALRRPTDKKRHPVHDEIRAPVFYLPEYLHDEPGARSRARLLAGLAAPGFWRALGAFAADLPRDFTRNRFRRFGQALVLAARMAEWRRMAACAFHPHAGLGHALRQPDARHPLDLLGACQGHLDVRRLGAQRKSLPRRAGR